MNESISLDLNIFWPVPRILTNCSLLMFFELVGVMNKSPYVEKLFDHIMSLEDNPGKQMFKIINWIYVKSMMNHRHVEVMYYSNLKCAEM